MSIKIEKASTAVSDEAVANLEKELNKTNEVLTEIKLRPQEVDVRELPDKDFKQATYRFMNDTLNALNMISQTLVDLEIIVLESLSANKKQKAIDALNGVEKKLKETPKEN
jgi:hypothetical protein